MPVKVVKGFTLVELIIGITVFSIIMMVIMCINPKQCAENK